MNKYYLLLLCGCAASTVAYADPVFVANGDQPIVESANVFSPFVSVYGNYNSNLFALENNQAALTALGSTQTSDFISTLAAGVNMNWYVSRQAFSGHVIVNQSRYNTYKMLDNNGNDILLQWDWLATDSLSGSAGVSQTTQLSNLTYIQAPIDDMFTTRNAFLKGAFKVGNHWQLKAGANAARYLNSVASLALYNLNINSFNVGAQYLTANGSTVEWVSQLSDGVYPSLQYNGTAPFAAKFTQTDNGIKVNWVTTEKTQLSGQINYTDHVSPDDPVQNYSGLTGRLEANWFVTGKTSLDWAVYRNIQPYDTSTTSYQLVQGTSLGVIWRATSKITGTLNLRHDSIDFPVATGFNVPGAEAMHMRADTATAGVEYFIFRNTKLSLSAGRGVRSSDAYGFSYTYNSFSVGLQQNF